VVSSGLEHRQDEEGTMSQLLYRLGQLAARRRWRMVAAWVGIAAAVIALGQTAGTSFTNDYRVPGVESQRAADLLLRSFPAMAGADATVVFHAQRGTVRDPRAKAGIAAALAELRRQPHVIEVDDPLDPRAGTVSPDGSVAFATVRSDLQPGEVTPGAFRRLDRAGDAARRAGLAVEFRGAIVDVASQPETGAAELFGLGAAVLILLMAFGSVVAMGLPIGTAMVGLLVGLSGVSLVGALVDIPTIAPLLAVMIGIGIGIDYALFVVTRFRQSLADGLTIQEAAGHANATAGQSVVFAGGTVVIAILGLWLTGIPFVGAMGLATAVVVTVAVLAAVTLLPALLGVVGRRIDRLRLPALRRRSQGAGPARSAWTRWGRAIDRRAWAYAFGALLVLLALATPLLALRLGTPDDGTLPPSATQRRAYDLLASGFGPGFNGPLLLAVELPPDNRQAPNRRMLLDRLARAAAADPGVAAVTQPALSPSGDAAVLTVLPSSSPQNQATTDLVTRFRQQLIPTARGDSSAQIYVGGLTATIIDLASQVADRLLLFIGAVVAVSFLLLVIVFRALLVPLKAALLNLLSIGAAYGVVVAIFQWGWAKGLVGLETTVPIISFVPMLMFAVLFGLSMDYEVFLLSRIREEYVATGDAHGSVVTAIAATARVITSAALIMVCVFVGFVFSPDPVLKMVGVGLAVAVAIDATIVRVVLVPALMSLLGDRAWWLPRWLDRTLPSVNLEATTPASSNAPTMDAPSAAGRDAERLSVP
jgi:putative drug exporter of the RND superfamily